MSCSCGCNPCNCQPRPSFCCTPTTESVEYLFENANLAGIGVFDNETDNLVQFRGIVSNSASLTVTFNATDNTIVFDFDDNALVADIPDATTTQRGILETATNAEALAKAAADKIITPSNLAALGSTTTFAGFVELATDAETIAGISATLAVTPAGLAAFAATNMLTTWPDAATRAGATPTFDGQIGTQLDTNVVWVANGTGAGDFDVPLLIGGANTLTALTSFTTAFQVLFTGAGSVSIETAFGASGVTTLTGSTVQIGNGAGEFLNFESPTFQISGGTITDSLLGADNTGLAVGYSIVSFLSLMNPQTGYTPVANPATIRTFDTATVTLQQLAQAFGTLIEDLKAVKLPQT